MSADILNKETIVRLEGTYVYSKGTEEVSGTTKVNAKFVSTEDIKSILYAGILSNKIYEIDGTNKRVLQIIIRSKIENNEYPAHTSNIELNIPENAESIEVIARDTSATNKDANFEQSNYTYNQEDSKLQIKLENNKDEDGNISFEQNAKDEFVVTCIYAEDKELEQTQINVSQEILTYDNKTLEADKQVIIDKQISIAKEDYTKVLGEEGYITVKDENGTVIANITKETEADESGNIIIQIPENTYKLEIETSRPVAVGKIDFEAVKSIIENEYEQEEIREITAIENIITVNEQSQTKQILLKETETLAKLTVDTDTLRAGENENVQIRVTLLADDESKDLYKNPNIRIVFPESTTEITAKYSILYGNGLEKESATLKEENGMKVLEINLAGEQKQYSGDAIEGTEIIINASIKMNELMPTSKENIVLTYTNEKAISYINGGAVVQKINVIQSEKFIVTKDIDELDVKTIGKEEEKQIDLEPSEQTRKATVKIGAINNEGENLENVKILGRFPTKNSTNTMDISLTSGINVTSNTQDAKVYYSTKENATVDLNNANNGWTEDVTLSDKKSYLIVIPTLANGESFGAEYRISIDQNVTESKTASEEFVVIYNKDNSSETTKIESTKVLFNIEYLTDGIIAVIEEGMVNDRLTTGNIYLYNLKIKNNSSDIIENIQVQVKLNDLFEINQYISDEVPADGVVNIEKLEAGEVKEIRIFVECLNKSKKEDKATIYAEVTANGEKYESNTLEQNVEDISAKVTISSAASNNNEERKVKIGEYIDYEINVENTCVDDISDLKIESTMTSFLKIEEITMDGEKVNNEEELSEDNMYKHLTIKTDISAKQSKKIVIKTKVEGAIRYSSEKDITNFVLLVYNSKVIANATDDGYDMQEGQTTGYEGISTEGGEIIPNKIIDTSNNEYISNDEDGTNETNAKSGYKITGSVWLDEEQNGNKLSNNKKIEGIKVRLIEETGSIAKDESGNEISAETNSNGEYTLTNIDYGRYIVVFEYDTNKYKPTEYQKDGVSESNNSDAIIKEISINGTTAIIAATDILNVNSNMSDIDLGLVETQNFDLELTKTVSKITVTTSEGIKEYEIKDKTLAKVEIASKQLNNSKVTIEYTIKVKNVGEISGYVKNIVDYMPSDIEFNSTLNKNWSKQGEYLYNTSLANEEIKAGETKEVNLILTKTMTESNTGLVSNIAEIAEAENSLGVADIDSTPNNRKNGEDEMGQADVIIGVNTGTIVKYIILTMSILIVGGVSVYLIKEKIIKTEI